MAVHGQLVVVSMRVSDLVGKRYLLPVCVQAGEHRQNGHVVVVMVVLQRPPT